MSDSDEHNVKLGVLEQLIGKKLKTAAGRRQVASFASTYCCDVATHGTKLDTSSHRMMLQRISEVLRSFADEEATVKEWEGSVVIRDGMLSDAVGLKRTDAKGCIVEEGSPLDKALIPFEGKRVHVRVIIEEVK